MRRFLSNSISGYLSSATTMVIGLLLTPFMVKRLGHEGFGAWVLITSLALYLTLLDFGLGGAVMRYVAEARARRDDAAVCAVVSTAFAIYLVAGVVSIGVTAALALVVLPALHVPRNLLDSAQLLLLGLGLGALCWLPAKAWDGAMRGAHRFDLANTIQIINALFLAGGTVLVLLAGGGLAGLALVNVVAGTVMAACQVTVGSRVVAGARLQRSLVDRRLAGELARYSGWSSAVNVSYQVYTRFDAVMLAIFLPVAAITPYNVAYRIASLLGEALSPVLKLLLPVTTELHTLGRSRDLRLLFLRSTRLSLAASLAVGTTLWFFGESLIRLWIGARLPEATAVLLVFLLFFAVSNLAAPAREVLKGQGRLRMLAFTAVGDTVANIALSAVLVHVLGIVGVALGSLIPLAVVNLVLLLPYVLRGLGVTGREFVREVVAASVPAMLSAIVVSLVITRFAPPDNWLRWLATALVSMAAFTIGYLMSPRSSFERDLVLGWVRVRRGRLPASAESAREVP